MAGGPQSFLPNANQQNSQLYVYSGAYDPRLVLTPALRGSLFVQIDNGTLGPINLFRKLDNNPTSLNWDIYTASISVPGSNSKLVWKNGSGDVISLESIGINSHGGLEYIKDIEFSNNEDFALNTTYFAYKPQENAPLSSVISNSTEIELDPDDTGFSIGGLNNPITANSVFVRAESTGNLGEVVFASRNIILGNGVDPIESRGISYSYGFGEVKNGVNLVGPVQGYGFQTIFRTGVTLDPITFYCAPFYDFSSYEDSCQYHTSFNSGPTIQSIADNRNMTGFNFNPTINQVGENSSLAGVNIFGQIGTFGENSFFHGMNINPTITEARFAVGLNVTMDNVGLYPGVPSSTTIQDLTMTALMAGSTGDMVNIQYIGGGTAGAEIVTNPATFQYVVQIEDGVSTAQNIADALNGFPAFSGFVNTVVTGVAGNPQTIQGPTFLSGGVNPGSKLAATFDGDVSISGDLSFGGSLSIGKLEAFATQAIVNGGGTPTSVHQLISNPTVPDNTNISNADTLGVNTAMLLQIGDNSIVTTSLTGVAALALPAVVAMGSGSSIDQLSGGLFALSLDATATGGTIENLDLCRSLAIPNGITAVDEMKGYRFDLPFGNPATVAWGFYEEPGVNNYFAGNLLIGGTPGTDDVVSNSNVGLEIKSTTKAFLPSRMTQVERDAITAIDGMVIFNTTTSKLQVYASGTWNDLH